jgi:hypothetical protein
MAGDGVVLKDLLPLPTDVPAATDPEKEEVSHALSEEPTLSHELANAGGVGGVVEEKHEEEVRDLGWNDPPDEIANPLVGKLPNEELWILIRRFNKVRRCARFSVRQS